MKPYLTLCLFAPIGAMGATVSGSRRTSDDHPTRSAILGLVAAALGIESSQQQRLRDLDSGLGVAMLVERTGELWTDFHTTQVPRGNKGWTTRNSELDAVTADDNPVTSWRDYRTNVVVFVALWTTSPTEHTLEAIAAAIRKPKFVLYMGRRCCPFGLPLNPQIVTAESPKAALLDRCRHGSERADLDRLRGFKPQPFLALDAKDASNGGARIYRNDRIASRERWQFLPRAEVIAMLNPSDLYAAQGEA